MNPNRRSPSEDEIDRLLSSRFQDTTPAFEARWRDLKRELRQAPARASRHRWQQALPWFGVAVAGAAAAWVLVLHRPAQPISLQPLSPALTELFELEAALAPATPLLDPEYRDVLLQIPLEPLS